MSALPGEWLTSVVQRRGGGRDSRGNPKTETERSVGPVAVGWRTSSDPVDRAELTTDSAVLYDQSGTTDWEGSDRVVIPADYPGPTGTWQVEGQPKRWPLGYECALRRA